MEQYPFLAAGLYELCEGQVISRLVGVQERGVSSMISATRELTAPLGHARNLSDFGASNFLQLTNLGLRANQLCSCFCTTRNGVWICWRNFRGTFYPPVCSWAAIPHAEKPAIRVS